MLLLASRTCKHQPCCVTRQALHLCYTASLFPHCISVPLHLCSPPFADIMSPRARLPACVCPCSRPAASCCCAASSRHGTAAAVAAAAAAAVVAAVAVAARRCLSRSWADGGMGTPAWQPVACSRCRTGSGSGAGTGMWYGCRLRLSCLRASCCPGGAKLGGCCLLVCGTHNCSVSSF